MHHSLTILQSRIDALAPPEMAAKGARAPILLGVDPVDRALNGALARGALHEFFAPRTVDMAVMAGFAAGLGWQAAGDEQKGHRRKIVWIRQRFTEIETGHIHAPGLAAFGLDPSRIIFVQTRHAEDVLRAGLEAVRCNGLGAVLIEIWGAPRAVDLTATRRLALAAEASGVTPLLLRIATEPTPSAARTRWKIASAPSSALAANAPGKPCFEITLLRNRAGTSGQRWHLEWDHEHKHFRQPATVSGAVDALPSQRPAATDQYRLARAS